MKRGLVIGKFLPLHKGHISLINFAKERCDELIVFAHKGDDDCIDITVRLGWLYKVFGDDKSIKIEANDILLPESSVPSKDVSRVWADYLIKRFPDVKVLFSSEKYGEYVSGY
ncbi:MAG TPA: adenylyltransferase/cytidyltransferase family protein, partial [Spirochaetota bacterium]|nr:adenylyltransferase/cytidyltransferase family protein [Spirochaetota bacterium]